MCQQDTFLIKTDQTPNNAHFSFLEFGTGYNNFLVSLLTEYIISKMSKLLNKIIDRYLARRISL